MQAGVTVYMHRGHGWLVMSKQSSFHWQQVFNKTFVYPPKFNLPVIFMGCVSQTLLGNCVVNLMWKFYCDSIIHCLYIRKLVVLQTWLLLGFWHWGFRASFQLTGIITHQFPFIWLWKRTGISLFSLPRGNQEQRSDPSYQFRNMSFFSLSKNGSQLPQTNLKLLWAAIGSRS